MRAAPHRQPRRPQVQATVEESGQWVEAPYLDGCADLSAIYHALAVRLLLCVDAEVLCARPIGLTRAMFRPGCRTSGVSAMRARCRHTASAPTRKLNKPTALRLG